MNIAKSLRIAFLHRTPLVVASETIIQKISSDIFHSQKKGLFIYPGHTSGSSQIHALAKIGKKIKQRLSNTLMLNFCYLKIIHILNPCYHPKLTWDILENIAKNNCFCLNEIIWLIIMKMRVKMKNKSHRYDIIELYQDIVTNILNIQCV